MEVASKIPMDRSFDIQLVDSNEENRTNALKSDDREHLMRENNESQNVQGKAEDTKVFLPQTPEIIRLLMQHVKKIKLEELRHKEQTIENIEHIRNDGILHKSGVLVQIQLYFVQVLKALYDYHREDAYAADAEANYRFHTQYIIDYVHIEFDEMAIKMLLHSDCPESRNYQSRTDSNAHTSRSEYNEFQYITSLWAELPKSFQRYLVIFEPLLLTAHNRSDFNLANHSCSDITLNLSSLRKLLKDRECRTYTCLLLEIQRSQNIIAYLQAQMIRSCAEMPEMIYQTDIQEAIQSVITPQVDTRQMNSMRKRLNSPQGLHNSAKKRHKVEYFDKALADPCAFKHLIMDRGANYAEQEDRSNSTVTVESSDFSYGHLPTHNSILQECKDYSRKDSQDLPQTFLALRYLNAYQRKITKLRERLAQSSQNKAEVKMEMQGCFTFGEPVERPFASKNSIKLQSNTNGVASDRSCQGINDYTKQFTDNPRPENADLVRKSQNDFNCELDSHNPRKDCEVTSEDNNAEEKEESCLINTIDETNNIGQESSIQSQVESILSYLLNFQEEDKETCDKDGKNMVFSNLNKSTANASERNQFQLLNEWLMPVLNTPPKKVAGGRLTHGASPKQKSSDNSKSDTTGLYEEESSPLANIANAEYELSPRAFRREDTAVNETLMRFDESLSTDRLPDLLSDELRPIKGVYFDRTQRSWIGSFYEDRRQIKKRFKVATYGYHTAKALAISVRLDFERKVEQITRGARISSVKLAVAKLDNNTHDNFLTEDSIQRHGQVSHAEQLFAAATAAALDAGEPGIDIPKVLKLRTFLQGPLGKTLTESERLELLQQVFRKQPKTHEERRNMQRLAADAAARKCKRRVPFLANTDVVFDAAMNAAEICGISIAANNESEPEHSIFQKLEKGASLQDLLSTPREYIGLAYDEKKALDSRADNGQPHLTPLHKKNEIMLPASKNHDYSYFGETIDILKNTFLEAGSDKSRNEVKYENPQKGDQRHIQTSAPVSKEQPGTEISGKPVTHIDEALELMVRIKSHFPGHHIP